MKDEYKTYRQCPFNESFGHKMQVQLQQGFFLALHWNRRDHGSQRASLSPWWKELLHSALFLCGFLAISSVFLWSKSVWMVTISSNILVWNNKIILPPEVKQIFKSEILAKDDASLSKNGWENFHSLESHEVDYESFDVASLI